MGVGGPSPDPMVADGVVYYATPDGTAYAYNESTGDELWNSGTTIAQGIAASPMVANGVLYVATFGADAHGTLFAFGL